MAGCDCVVAIGGGSVIDTAKAIAALVVNTAGALAYMEAVGSGHQLERPALAVIAVPTTAGAGSEATRNAVIRSAQHKAKASIRDVSLLPRLALVDPELSMDLPASVTAACGMDALTQLIEAFVGRRANPLTDGLCREGLRLAARSIRHVVTTPDLQSRSDMATAALLSGMALANAGLGAVHGIAAPLGGVANAPHGAICAALLAPITASTIQVLQRSDPTNQALARYAEVAALFGCEPHASALPAFLQQLASELGIAQLSKYGVAERDIPLVAEQAAGSSGARNNPALLEAAELAEAIRAVW
jgi:alcohol dehydrogenase class IV